MVAAVEKRSAALLAALREWARLVGPAALTKQSEYKSVSFGCFTRCVTHDGKEETFEYTLSPGDDDNVVIKWPWKD